MMTKVLIIGGGFAGCAAADLLKKISSMEITLVERGPFLGAGVRTFFYGGHPYTFGPRHFLTQNEAVFNYLNNIVPMRRCAEHEFKTYVEQDNAFYNYPIHEDDIKIMPDFDKICAERKVATGVQNAKNLEEYWIGSVGRTLYDKFIEKYNYKMWMVDDNKVIDTFGWSPKGVDIKSGPRAAWDIAISSYPIAHDGYNYFFDYATSGVKVLLNTKIEQYEIGHKRVKIEGVWSEFDVIINTISPDIIFNEAYGELPYIGRDLLKIVVPTETVFPENVYWVYYANDEPFTRIVEYKKFTLHKSNSSLLGLEIPSLNGKHYPLPFKQEIERAKKYFNDMPNHVYSIGRAGSYRYGLDIDDCIEQAMVMVDQIKSGGRDYPVPLDKWRD